MLARWTVNIKTTTPTIEMQSTTHIHPGNGCASTASIRTQNWRSCVCLVHRLQRNYCVYCVVVCLARDLRELVGREQWHRLNLSRSWACRQISSTLIFDQWIPKSRHMPRALVSASTVLCNTAMQPLASFDGDVISWD